MVECLDGGTVYTADLTGKNLSTRGEILCVNLVKFGETFTGNPEPSLVKQEGVET